MKFRCPYCKHVYEGGVRTICPACGKTMMIPGRLLKVSPRERRKAKERIAREAERKRVAPQVPNVLLSGNGFRVAVFLGIMLLVSAIFVVGIRTNPETEHQHRRTFRAIEEIGVLLIALERYKADCGGYPSESEGLKALVRNPGVPKWNGPYVNLIKPDPWNKPYLYKANSNAVTLLSNGPDRKRYTADDLIETNQDHSQF